MLGINASSVALKKDVWSPLNLGSPGGSGWWVSKQWDRPMSTSPSPSAGVAYACVHTWHFMWVLEMGTQILKLAWQTLD